MHFTSASRLSAGVGSVLLFVLFSVENCSPRSPSVALFLVVMCFFFVFVLLYYYIFTFSRCAIVRICVCTQFSHSLFFSMCGLSCFSMCNCCSLFTKRISCVCVRVCACVNFVSFRLSVPKLPVVLCVCVCVIFLFFFHTSSFVVLSVQKFFFSFVTQI